MDNETMMEIADINKYQEGLQTELEALKEEKKALEEKDILTNKEEKRLEKVKSLIKTNNERLQIFNAWNLIPQVRENLKKLSPDMTEDINTIVNYIFNEVIKIGSIIITALRTKGIAVSNYHELQKLAQDLKTEITTLENKKNEQSRGLGTQSYEDEIAEKEALLEEIEPLLKYYELVNKHLKNWLFSLTENLLDEEKKSNIITNITNMLDDYEAHLYDAIEIIMKKNNKLSKILSNILATLNKHKGKIIAGIAGITILGVLVSSWQKDNSKNNSHNETTEPYGTESTYESTESELETQITFDTTPTEAVTEPTINPTVEALINKGYDEETAELMAYNFSEDAIDTILDADYNPVFASYANIPEFNPNYTNDYEEMKMLYDNIPGFKVVDFVNRGHKIMETGFYTDVLLSDVVDSLIIIDSDQMHRPENAPVAQNIMVACNKIVDNYLFGTTTEDDINKLEAYKYFAKEGSDLDNFLTRLSTLVQNILRNPNDEKAKDELYQFYYIFATSFNGFTNEKDALTNNPDFNEDAIVNSYYTYYVGYRYFIESIMAIGHPISIETEDNIEEITKWEDLKYLIETAFQGPEFEALCGQSRTLGGE